MTASMQWSQNPLPTKSVLYDIKPPDGGALVLEISGMWSTFFIAIATQVH